MTNSDYLLKATVKKLGEKINKTFFEKIVDATNAAQEVPEMIKKEIETLKDEIIKEAERMGNKYENEFYENDLERENNSKSKALNKIKEINKQIEILNNKLNN